MRLAVMCGCCDGEGSPAPECVHDILPCSLCWLHCSYPYDSDQAVPNSLAVAYNWICMVIAVLVIELLLFRKQHSLTVAITGTYCLLCSTGCSERRMLGPWGTQGASHLETRKLVTTSLAMHCALEAAVVVWVCLLHTARVCKSAGRISSFARLLMVGHGVHSLPCAWHHSATGAAILLYQKQQTGPIQKWKTKIMK